MANHIEIEITSKRSDGSFTWRAKGAKEPKGVVDPVIVGVDTVVGEVFKAEFESWLDGVQIVSAIKSSKKIGSSNDIEILGPRQFKAGVTATLIAKKQQNKARKPRNDKDDMTRDRSPKRENRANNVLGNNRDKARDKDHDGYRERSKDKRTTNRHKPEPIAVGTFYKDKLMHSLEIQERPIADYLFDGGLPAVREAIANQQKEAKEKNLPPIIETPLLAIAERLMPQIRDALWRDRADAILKLDRVTLKDLRSLIVSAHPRDEEERKIVADLKDRLSKKISDVATSWQGQVKSSTEAGKLKEALELSTKSPDHSVSLNSEIAELLASKVSAALNKDLNPTEWIELVEAASQAPIRKLIKPASVPEDATGEVEKTSKKLAGLIPQLAPIIGLKIPPPPRPTHGGVIVKSFPTNNP